MDIEKLKARIEEHLGAFAHQMDANAIGCLRQFADWLSDKQAQEAELQSHVEWLQSRGYTVVAPQPVAAS